MKYNTIGNLHVETTIFLLTLNVKSVVVLGTSTLGEHFCCKYLFLIFISFIFMQINSSLISFLKFVYFYTPRFYYGKLPIMLFYAGFFAATAHHQIIFMFLLSLEFCESFRYILAVFMEKFPKIGYLNYLKRRVVYILPNYLVLYESMGSFR